MAILVAINDDDRFETVLQVAARFGKGLDQDLVVVHVTANENASGSDRGFRDDAQEIVSKTDIQTEVTLEHLNRDGLRSGTAVGKQLLDVAKEVDVDYVVIGHRSKTQLEKLRDGHTGFVVAEEANVPVTLVPESTEV